MSGERLTWSEIVKKYPHRTVGMVDVHFKDDGATIKDAIVKYTDADTPYEKLILMMLRHEIILLPTTPDQDCPFGALMFEDEADNGKTEGLAEEIESGQSYELAKQAEREMARDGHVSVVCPRCHGHPVITTSPHGERTYVMCKCLYIYKVEIF